MATNIGEELMLTVNSDLDFNHNGDILLCSELEAAMPTVPFVGYVAIREWLHDLFKTIEGSHPFEDFGTNTLLYLSQPRDVVKFKIQEEFPAKILGDDRFAEVSEIKFQDVGQNRVDVFIYARVIGEEKVSEFVYPFITGN